MGGDRRPTPRGVRQDDADVVIDTTGISRVMVEAIHSGICWIDQFMSECPRSPAPSARGTAAAVFKNPRRPIPAHVLVLKFPNSSMVRYEGGSYCVR